MILLFSGGAVQIFLKGDVLAVRQLQKDRVLHAVIELFVMHRGEGYEGLDIPPHLLILCAIGIAKRGCKSGAGNVRPHECGNAGRQIYLRAACKGVEPEIGGKKLLAKRAYKLKRRV